jgi:hypothetical protein
MEGGDNRRWLSVLDATGLLSWWRSVGQEAPSPERDGVELAAESPHGRLARGEV